MSSPSADQPSIADTVGAGADAAVGPFFIEERTYYPTGYDPTDRWCEVNGYTWQVGVFYRGDGLWMVARQREGHQQFTHTGKQLWMPSRMMQKRWCRFPFEQACQIAESVVDQVTALGRTFAQALALRDASRS